MKSARTADLCFKTDSGAICGKDLTMATQPIIDIGQTNMGMSSIFLNFLSTLRRKEGKAEKLSMKIES